MLIGAVNRCGLWWLRSLSVVKLEARVTARLAWGLKSNSLQIYLNSQEQRQMVVKQLQHRRAQM